MTALYPINTGGVSEEEGGTRGRKEEKRKKWKREEGRMGGRKRVREGEREEETER